MELPSPSLQGKLARKLPFPLLPLFAFRNPTLNCDNSKKPKTLIAEYPKKYESLTQNTDNLKLKDAKPPNPALQAMSPSEQVKKEQWLQFVQMIYIDWRRGEDFLYRIWWAPIVGSLSKRNHHSHLSTVQIGKAIV